jgi:hypothetical protein
MSDSDSNHDGPAEYSDDDDYEYDESNPDRSSVISTGARASKQYRESRMTFKNNRETLTQTLNPRQAPEIVHRALRCCSR